MKQHQAEQGHDCRDPRLHRRPRRLGLRLELIPRERGEADRERAEANRQPEGLAVGQIEQRGKRRLSRSAFEAKWTGYSALFDYTTDFERAPTGRRSLAWLVPFFARYRTVLLQVLLLAGAYLSHTSTLAILFVATIAIAALFRLGGSPALRSPSAAVLLATTIASILALVLYYAHFMDTYRSEFHRLSHETASAAVDAGGRTIGSRLEAVPYYVRAIELGLPAEELRDAYLGLGSTYRVLGQYEQAIATLEKGLATFPGGREFIVFKAMVEHNAGRSKPAVEALLRVISETSSDVQLQKFRRAIMLYAGDVERTLP